MKKNKPLIMGISGSIGLLIIYFGILSISNSFSHALDQFVTMWYWIAALAAGFGLQLGLYFYIREALRKKLTGTGAEVAAAGGVSATAMVACCAHHLADILPIIGLSAAAIFLVKYQLSFILLGVFSNLIGIALMLNHIQIHGLYQNTGLLKTIFSFNMKKIMYAIIILAIIIVPYSFVAAAGKRVSRMPAETKQSKEFKLAAKENNENFISIKVQPVDFSFNEPVKFYISLNTHQGALDFDLTKISFLEDDRGNIYKPLSWAGSPSGGHHRSGTLKFPKLFGAAKSIKLTIKNVYNVPERVFEWVLR